MIYRKLTRVGLGASAVSGIVLVASCGVGSGTSGGGGTPSGGQSTGRVRIESGPGLRTVVEHEPNDWPNASQFLGQSVPGQTYHVLARIDSPPPNSDVDTFRLTAAEPMTVTWTVTSWEPTASAEFNLDLGIIDFRQFACELGGIPGQVFSECQTSVISRSGSFLADGTVEIAVVPRTGAGSYTLTLALESTTETQKPTGRAWITAGAVQARSETRPEDIARAKEDDVSSRPAGEVPASPLGPVVPGQTLAKFDPQCSAERVEALVKVRGLRIVERSPSGWYRLDGPGSDDSDPQRMRVRAEQAAADLRSEPDVRWSEPNQVFRAAALPDDLRYSDQRYPSILRLPEAWNVTTGARDVVVAAIDTGVLFQHPDLGGRLLGGYDFVSDPQKSLDGDGRDDDPSDPGAGSNNDAPTTFHGTHVAGTIGAMVNNEIGVAGVTWNCRLMPIRGLGLGSAGDAFDIAEAIRYAAGLENVSQTLPPRRADVINLSFDSGAGSSPSLIIQEAVADAVAVGVLVVAAAGNQGSPQPSFPAGSEEVVSVGALAWDLDRATYSNYGSTVEIMAPGGEYDPSPGGEARGLLSTTASNVGGALQFDYGYRFGTSMATPQVAGTAALMWSINPGLSVRQVRSILRETANDLGDPGRDDQFGYGLLDAAAAVSRAAAEIGEAARPPRLVLSPTVLDFGNDRTAMTIEVDNGGDGVIVVNRITPREQVGSGWLSVEAAAGASSAEPRIDVSVDRSQLPAGPFFGQVEVTASGVAFSEVEVYGVATGSPGYNGWVSAATLDPASGAVGTRTIIADLDDGTFVLDSGHFERVLLYAGSDRDGDGLICEPQDACGAWPSLLNPLEVTIADLPTAGPIEIVVYEPPPGSGWPQYLLP